MLRFSTAQSIVWHLAFLEAHKLASLDGIDISRWCAVSSGILIAERCAVPFGNGVTSGKPPVFEPCINFKVCRSTVVCNALILVAQIFGLKSMQLRKIKWINKFKRTHE